MSNRMNPPINAGSMADIAFLLLIFFLVTTSMDQDEGLLRQLPSISEEVDATPAQEHKVFKIMINQNDDLLVEDQEMELADLKTAVKGFLTNGGVFNDALINADHVSRHWIDAASKKQRLQGLKNGEVEVSTSLQEIKEIEAELHAIELFGLFKEMDSGAVVSLQNSVETSYNTYIQVQNEVSAALNELRDELSINHFRKDYLDLDSRIPEEKAAIMAIRQIYPQRVSEADVMDRTASHTNQTSN